LSIFRSAFEKLSVENQIAIADATRITAQAVSPGGALFGKVEELIRVIAAQGKNAEKTSSPGLGSSMAMKLFGGKGLTNIGKGLQEIVKALNNLQGDGKSNSEKFQAIALGIESLSQMGPAILKFAGYLALAAPLMLIGSITAPLWGISVWIIAKTLEMVTKPLASESVKMAMEGMQKAAVAILLLGAAMVLAVPLYTYGIQSIPMIAVTLLILGGTFMLLDKMGVAKSMKQTSIALMLASAAIVTVGLSLLLASIILDAIPDKWTTLMQIMGLIAGVGIIFALAGLVKNQIAYGAAAMIFTAIPIILLSLAAVIFASSISPDANGWITIGQILALTTGVGAVMAVAGAAAAFIIPGAVAMILAGVAIAAIAGGAMLLANVFNGGKLNQLLDDSGHVTDSFLGFGGGRMMSKMEYFMYSLANSFLINPAAIASMYATVPVMLLSGVALMSIAKGIEAFQKLKINYDVLPDQISKVTTVLASSFGAIGSKFPGGRNFLSMVGLGSQSAVADGIDAVLGMGNALSSIAQGVQSMANLRFPIYQGTKIVGYNTIDSNVFEKVKVNAGMLTNGLADVFGEIGLKYPGGRNFLGLGDGQSPVVDGINVVTGMGNAVAEIAKGVQSMADLKFPIYQGTKIVGYTTLTNEVFNRVRGNIQNLVSGISGVFGNIGKSPDAEDAWGWFGKSNIERGISLVEDFADPLNRLVNTAKIISSNAIDPVALKSKITGIIDAFTSAYAAAGKNKTIDMEMVTMTGNLASNIKNIVQNANGFSKFVDSYGRYVNHFVKFKDAVNQFDRENLKLTNDIFNGLTYLAKTDNAIEEMGEQLTGAIKKLADMIQEAKTTIQSSGESSTGAMEAVGQGVSKVGDLLSSLNPFSDDKPAPVPTAAPKPGTPAAAAAASVKNSTEITALVTALEELIAKFNDASGATAPIVRVLR
jgi:hypothetical protein